MTWKFEKQNSDNHPITYTNLLSYICKIFNLLGKNHRVMKYRNNLYTFISGIYQTNCSAPCRVARCQRHNTLHL